jgi:hypothetical protein
MNIDEVCQEFSAAAVGFRLAYRAKHYENPEHYPLELPKENSGLWYEFFITFLMDGTV